MIPQKDNIIDINDILNKSSNAKKETKDDISLEEIGEDIKEVKKIASKIYCSLNHKNHEMAYDKDNQYEEKIQSLTEEIRLREKKLDEYKKYERVKENMKKYGFISYGIYFIASFILCISSGCLYLLWRIKDIYTFNPGALFMISIITLVWALTALTGILTLNKRKW
ncbi:hypothetical protein HF846_08610 [Clostridium cadaveris]|uniref:hypothetical protein n=1 Tax=Clostridium cadaveris TaxID=1529 RepID=UPI0014594828|nr:hypothetical protein [Clostridium cadaveris]NME64659.1 hypothetical protein [Clostridium cadaveris]